MHTYKEARGKLEDIRVERVGDDSCRIYGVTDNPFKVTDETAQKLLSALQKFFKREQ